MTFNQQLSLLAIALCLLALACAEDSGGGPTMPEPMPDMSVEQDVSITMTDMDTPQVDAAMRMRCLRDDQCEAGEYCAELEDGDQTCRPGCREDS